MKEDAAEMEALIASTKRPKVRALLRDYLTQLQAEIRTRTDGKAAPPAAVSKAAAPAPAAPAPAPPAPAAAAPAAVSSKPPAPAPSPHAPVKLAKPPPAPAKNEYVTISSMAWDQDAYGKDPQHVFVYILSGIDGVGEVKDQVTCDFTKNSFDLKIHGLKGKNYRLFKNNLDKEIVPGESTCVVKKNKVTLNLRKVRRSPAVVSPQSRPRASSLQRLVRQRIATLRCDGLISPLNARDSWLQCKGQYGYDQWLDLVAKRPKAEDKETDPSAGIMDMMKQREWMGLSVGHDGCLGRKTWFETLGLEDHVGHLDWDAYAGCALRVEAEQRRGLQPPPL